jgi:hypothetical protein
MPSTHNNTNTNKNNHPTTIILHFNNKIFKTNLNYLLQSSIKFRQHITRASQQHISRKCLNKTTHYIISLDYILLKHLSEIASKAEIEYALSIFLSLTEIMYQRNHPFLFQINSNPSMVNHIVIRIAKLFHANGIAVLAKQYAKIK